MTVNIAVVGLGAFGQKHLDALTQIPGRQDPVRGTQHDGQSQGGRRRSTGPKRLHRLHANCWQQEDLDGVILATPTQMHHAQTLEALRAGKHVMVEIPMADSLAGVQEIVGRTGETGLIAMAGHTRRFNPSHQFVHNRITAGEFSIQQMDVQTYFFRRTNTNALGAGPLLDRPSAVAPCCPHGRPVPVPDRREGCEGQRRSGT